MRLLDERRIEVDAGAHHAHTCALSAHLRTRSRAVDAAPALFSIPIWWLQPISDNIATMAFNIRQSLLSYEPLAKEQEESA